MPQRQKPQSPGNVQQQPELESTAFLIGRLIRRKPYLAASAVWVFVVAMASLLGLPRSWTWGSIWIGLIVLLILSGIQQDKARSADPDYVAPATMWRGRWGVITAFMLVLSGILSVPVFESQRQAAERREAAEASAKLSKMYENMQAASEAFWNVAVADLDEARFSVPSEAMTAPEYLRQQIASLRTGVEAARIYQQRRDDKFLIDSRLSEMCERHLQLDEEELELMSELLQTADARGLLDDRTPAAVRARHGTAILESITTQQTSAEDVAADWGVPISIVERMVSLEQKRELQFEEIREMQAALRERFDSSEFALPENPVSY